MKNRSRHILILVFVFLSGCAADSSGEVSPSYAASPLASMPPKVKLGNEGWKPSKPLPNYDLSDEEKAHYRKVYLEGKGDDEHPVDVSKLPDLVTYVSLEESGSVMSVCLRQAGWESEVTSGGRGINMDIPPGQEEQVRQAELACEAMYTPDPRILKLAKKGPAPREILEAYYEYHSGFLSECLARYGYQLKVPAKEVFIASQSSLDADVDFGYPENDWEVSVACPESPPSEALLGSPP